MAKERGSSSGVSLPSLYKLCRLLQDPALVISPEQLSLLWKCTLQRIDLPFFGREIIWRIPSRTAGGERRCYRWWGTARPAR
jgi:hypothetical protein